MAAKKPQRTMEYGKPPKSLIGEPFYGIELDAEQQVFADAIWNSDSTKAHPNLRVCRK